MARPSSPHATTLQLLAGFALGLAALPGALAAVSEVWWNVTYVDNVNPDGLFPRRVIGVNGTWPPPPIEVNANDTLLLHATNSLDEPMTLHYHGLYFNNQSWFDGAMDVTQCGIPPGNSFTYEVDLNVSQQWGTYWIHAHSNGQYVDGLRAPVVIHPEKEIHEYDEEFTVVLGDWYHTNHTELMKQFISPENPDGVEPIPDAPLIYFAQNGTYLQGFNENATLPFEAKKTYRLRILNTGAFAMFYFWIDGHQMRVIEVDGVDVEEMPVDYLSLSVAQRYSVLVTAHDYSAINWAVHANMDPGMFDTVPDTLALNATASITYASNFGFNEPSTLPAYIPTNDTALVPISTIPQYPPANRTITLEVAFETMTDGTNRAMFNNVTYNAPVVPPLLSALSLDEVAGKDAADDASAYGPWNFVIQPGEIVDLVVKNGDDGGHPFHLHGHNFQIIHRASNYSSSDPIENPPMQEGQVNPARRDTVYLDGGASATLRFVADNWGVWLFHCHIEWHLESGLAITLVEAPELMDAFAQANPPPSTLFSQCAAQGVPTTGNAAGRNSTTDLTGLTIGPFRVDGDSSSAYSTSTSTPSAMTSTSIGPVPTSCPDSPWPYALGDCASAPAEQQPYNPQFADLVLYSYEDDGEDVVAVDDVEVFDVDEDGDEGVVEMEVMEAV